MKIELDKNSLVDLVKGATPHYDVMEDPIFKKLVGILAAFTISGNGVLQTSSNCLSRISIRCIPSARIAGRKSKTTVPKNAN
jgi:hypothetical protein